MNADADEGNLIEIFQHESNQAWSHYRHLESTRTTYLNYFFTINIASAGFIATILGSPHIGIGQLYGISIFSLLVSLSSTIIFANIVRIAHVLGVYERILTNSRRIIFERNLLNHKDYLQLFDIRKGLSDSVGRNSFSVQKMAELILVIFSGLLIVGEIVVTIFLAKTLAWHTWYVYAPIGAALVMASALYLVVTTASRARRALQIGEST